MMYRGQSIPYSDLLCRCQLGKKTEPHVKTFVSSKIIPYWQIEMKGFFEII